ncbi:MAG TPA: metallophosphoesterase [Geobacteraceae bacterium]|nr:metallophosphoesterase [Geobacteraceae bacterium]
MIKHYRPQLRYLFRMAIVAMIGVLLASTCNAGTFFERSLAKMGERAQKASPQDFTFVVLGDSRDDEEIFRKALMLAATFDPLFILHDGDFSLAGTPKEVDHFLEVVHGTAPDIPLFVIPGNHEQKKPFREKIGPLEFVLDSPRLGFKVVVVDNSNYSLKAQQLTYLKDRLAEKRKFTFVAMHIPPQTARWNWHTFSDGAPELISLLAEKKVTAAFYGHIHLYDRDDIKGVPHIITGGAGARLISIGFPGDAVHHIVVVRVKDGAATCTMVKIPE